MMMKKLGNASNELGKYFLAVECDYKEAFRWFERGCKIFGDIEGMYLIMFISLHCWFCARN